MGQGVVAPIPVSEIAAYLDVIKEDDVDERERYIRMVSAFDMEYVDYVNKQLRREREAQARKAKMQSRRR